MEAMCKNLDGIGVDLSKLQTFTVDDIQAWMEKAYDNAQLDRQRREKVTLSDNMQMNWLFMYGFVLELKSVPVQQLFN